MQRKQLAKHVHEKQNFRLYLELHNLLFDSFQVCANRRHGVQFALQDVHPVKHALRCEEGEAQLLRDDMAQRAGSRISRLLRVGGSQAAMRSTFPFPEEACGRPNAAKHSLVPELLFIVSNLMGLS